VKHKYQDATHAELPSILAQMWKDADPNEKQLFLDEQFRSEQQYNETLLEWEKINNSNSPETVTTATTLRTRCLWG